MLSHWLEAVCPPAPRQEVAATLPQLIAIGSVLSTVPLQNTIAYNDISQRYRYQHSTTSKPQSSSIPKFKVADLLHCTSGRSPPLLYQLCRLWATGLVLPSAFCSAVLHGSGTTSAEQLGKHKNVGIRRSEHRNLTSEINIRVTLPDDLFGNAHLQRPMNQHIKIGY